MGFTQKGLLSNSFNPEMQALHQNTQRQYQDQVKLNLIKQFSSEEARVVFEQATALRQMCQIHLSRISCIMLLISFSGYRWG